MTARRPRTASARHTIDELLDRRARVVLALDRTARLRQEHPARPRGPPQRGDDRVESPRRRAPRPQARPRPAGAAGAGRVGRRQSGDLAARCDPGRGRHRAGERTRRLVGAPAGARPVPGHARRPGRGRPGRRPPRRGRMDRAADRVPPRQPLRGHLQVLRPARPARRPGRRAGGPAVHGQAGPALPRPLVPRGRAARDRRLRPDRRARRAAPGPGVRRPAQLPAPGQFGAARPGGQPAAADDDRHRAPVPGGAAGQPGRPLRGDLPGPPLAPGPGQGPARAAVLAGQAGAAGLARVPDDARPRERPARRPRP